MKHTGLALAVGLLLLAPGVSAQDDPAIVFGIYYRCSQGLEAQADEVVREVFAPVVQRHVDAGRLTGWLWLTHDQGGAWRKVLVTTGNDLGQMMQVRDEIIAELGDDDRMTALFTACPGHDDYIWMGVDVSSNNPDATGNATVSSYHMCNRSREGRADQIFTEVLAPLYQKHIDLGHLATYGFYLHRVGGVFRRLETVSGADHTTVLNMQGAVYEEAFATNPFAMQEFTEICQTHTDYLWSNTTPTN